MKLKNKIGALIASTAIVVGGLMSLASTASAEPLTPALNVSCSLTDTATTGSNFCATNSPMFNGAGHVTRWYAPGTWTITFKVNSCTLKGAFQGDGNLVFYRNGVAVWQSHTSGKASPIMAQQADGNIVIYHETAAGGVDTAYWNAGYSHPGTNLTYNMTVAVYNNLSRQSTLALYGAGAPVTIGGPLGAPC